MGHRRGRRVGNSRVQLIVFLVVPILLISAGSIGFALVSSNQTRTYLNLTPASYEIEPTRYWVQSYNGFGYEIQEVSDTSTYEIVFTDPCVLPGWELILITEIHNDGSVCNLKYTIYNSSQANSTDWTQTDEAGLYEATGMRYESVFYRDSSLTTPIVPPNLDISPDESVYHSDHLIFDPDATFSGSFLNESFGIRIVVEAVPPDPTPYLSFGGH
jgi:hypothetical protein